MILIDCVYLNSLGGLNVLYTILNYLKKKGFEKRITLLCDNRNKFIANLHQEYKVVVINKNEFARTFFYLRNKKSFKTFVFLSNVPPPIKLNSVFIYFHNHAFLHNINLKTYLKKKLIKLYNKPNYTWAFQTENKLDLIIKTFKINKSKILIAPIFSKRKFNTTSKNKNQFIYPATYNSHKNHFILIIAFIEAAKNTNKVIELILTISKMEFNNLNLNIEIPKNLKINLKGTLSQDELFYNLSMSEFMIFPSIYESFGLPLIEGIYSKCKILTSDLDYVNQVILPSLVFDPKNVDSIKSVILKAINSKIKEPKIKVTPKTHFFVNTILNEKN